MKKKAINSTLVLRGPAGDAAGLMRVFLILLCFCSSVLLGQQDQTGSVGGRLTIYGGDSALRVAMVQDAETVIKDLDQLVGVQGGKPNPIVLQLYPETEGGESMIARQFLKLEDGSKKYQLKVDLRLGRGKSFDRDQLERVLLEMLLIERTLRALPEGESAERVEVRPWLIDGMQEALLWSRNKGDRRMYSSLVDSGGWIEVEKLADRKTVGDLDVLSRELFRASSGALVMALFAQPQGKESMSNFLENVAIYEGEPLNLLRTYFPQVNLGARGLERWWMLQVAAMSEQKLTEAMTISETEQELAKILEFHLLNSAGQAYRVGIESWPVVAMISTPKERLDSVRPASDLLVHLSFRCFPTYRPVIGGYLSLLSDLAEGKAENPAEVIENLQVFRNAESERYEKLIDLLDWHHLSNIKKESGEFEDFLRLTQNIRKGDDLKNDPVQSYLDEVQEIFELAESR